MGGFGSQWFPIKQKNDGSLDLNAKNEILNSVKLINRYIDEIELDTGISSKNFIFGRVFTGNNDGIGNIIIKRKKN